MTPLSLAHARRMARLVAERAAHVGVVTQRATEFAAQIPAEVPIGFASASPRTASAQIRREDRPSYLVTLATLRFGSGYEPRLGLPAGVELGPWLAERLAEHCGQAGPIEPARMATATPGLVADLLGLDAIDPAHSELVELQARALRDLGRFLLELREGSVQELLESVDGSATRLCEELATMPFFHDVQSYRGLDVPFLCRAQRLVLDLHGVFGGEGLGRFEDLRELAPSSDAPVVAVLRGLGALVLEPVLARRIDQGELVPAHSEREVELRAAAVHAVDLIAAATAELGSPKSAFEVDAWLRRLGAEPDPARPPQHRTRTVYY